MHVVRHDDEVMQLETLRRDAIAQNIDEQDRVAFGLQEPLPHVGLRGHEECAMRIENVCGVRIAWRDGHRWYSGAKALNDCCGFTARLKAVP